MHRFTQDFLPASFNQVWVRNNIRNIGENEIQLRNRNRIQAPPSRLAITDRLPTANFARIWEQFPDEQIKIIRKKIEFDEKLKIFLSKGSCREHSLQQTFLPILFKNLNVFVFFFFFSIQKRIFAFLFRLSSSSYNFTLSYIQTSLCFGCPACPNAHPS